ncbi:MAG: DNA-binding domain-containing protein [Paludibacter sp.]|nr:DNA-binding domain-containing protein [Paludibacter sp.]
MKNVLKVWLKRRQLYNNPNSYFAQVNVNNNFSIDTIIDEIVKEGLVDNKESALEFMKHFNKKAAELLLNGNEVDTGLVKLIPQATGLIENKSWNPIYNSIDVEIKKSNELVYAISDTYVQITGADEEFYDVFNSKLDSQYEDGVAKNAEFFGNIRKKTAEVPPCGIAFRNWILKA